MVKSETRRDAEILVRNPSPRLFGEKFRDSKRVKANHEKTRLRDLPKTLPRFRDPAKIFRDPRFSRYHSPPLKPVMVSMKREYVRLLRNSNFKLNYASTRICILLVFLEVKSPQAHLLPSASQFYVSSFISTFRFFFPK